MKKIEFKVSQFTINTFFPKELIKSKLQVLEILMEATRYMLINPKVDPENVKGKIILLVDKMSRLFFMTENKYYSIAFPFLTIAHRRNLEFYFENDDIEIDSQLISNIVSVLKDGSFSLPSSLGFIESIDDFESEYNEKFWTFLRELLLHEDGYIRYDKDVIGYQLAKEKGEEHRHPINHFDVCYSTAATYKIGIEKELTEIDFIDLLNIKTNCRYLK